MKLEITRIIVVMKIKFEKIEYSQIPLSLTIGYHVKMNKNKNDCFPYILNIKNLNLTFKPKNKYETIMMIKNLDTMYESKNQYEQLLLNHAIFYVNILFHHTDQA